MATSKIIRPGKAPFDLSSIQKADSFVSFIEKEMDKKSIAEAPKIIGSDALKEFGEKLVRLHRPGSFDYAAKFGIAEVDVAKAVKAHPVVAKQEAPCYESAPEKPANKSTCKHCRSENLAIVYGKFG